MGACNSNSCNSKRLRRKSFNQKVDYDNVNDEFPTFDDEVFIF